MRLTGTGNAGAYIYPPMPATTNAVKNIIDVYATPAMEVNSKVVFTNTTPIGAYRGAGRPEGNYYMERLIDTAAREMGIDNVELRRRNHIAPAQMPYKAPSGMNYDSRRVHHRARQGAAGRRLAGLRQAQGREPGRGQAARPRHRLLSRGHRPAGQGIWRRALRGRRHHHHAERHARLRPGPLPRPSPRCWAASSAFRSTHFRLLQGDSDQLKVGGGTGGSKSALVASQAFLEAGDKVIEQGKQIAAHVLEASAVDIEFARGRFTIAGTDRGIGILELADKLRSGLKLPADVPQSLDVSHISDNPPFSFPNGCHIAEVEIDRDTGAIEVVRYFMVNDFGTVINPMLTAGQAHGGVMQGIGQALMERTVYDPQGQPVAGSYMDYALPRAAGRAGLSVQNHSVPCKTNLLGVKGCGEAGCAGALPSVMNAVVDALCEFGVTHIDMPVTPEKVWRVLNGGRMTVCD